jgi:hypothetical protein
MKYLFWIKMIYSQWLGSGFVESMVNTVVLYLMLVCVKGISLYERIESAH